MNRLALTFCLAAIVAASPHAPAFGEQATGAIDHFPARSSDELPELTEGATLEDYLVYAALKSPALEAAFYEWQAALKKIPEARSLPDPELSYGYFIREVETRVGPQQQRFGLSQMIPWFGKLGLRGEIALQEAHSAEQQYEAAKRRLFRQVKETWYEYYYLGRAITITRENIDLLSYLESVARTKYRAGAGPHEAVIRAQVELGKLEDRLKSLEDQQQPVRARLNALLNRPSGAPLPLPESIPVEPLSLSEEELLAQLKDGNPLLRALDFTAARQEAAGRLARKNFYPDFMLGVDYIDTDRAIAPTRDSGKDPVMARVAINLPLWQGKYRAAVDEYQKRQKAAMAQRADRENQLVADLQMALYRFRDAERKIELYGDALIPKAEESLHVIQQAFAADRADFLDLIDAERLLLEFQLSHERAVADRAQQLAEIESLVGANLSGMR